jgi:hypothetical protein
MIDLQRVDEWLKNLVELAEAGNREQVLLQGQILLEEIDRASKPHYPDYKTGTRTAPPPTYVHGYERYAAAKPHLSNAMNHAEAGDMPTVLKDLSLARQAVRLGEPKK